MTLGRPDDANLNFVVYEVADAALGRTLTFVLSLCIELLFIIIMMNFYYFRVGSTLNR